MRRAAQLEHAILNGAGASAHQVYADWYEAQGDSVMAAFIRVLVGGDHKTYERFVKAELRPTLGDPWRTKLQPFWRSELDERGVSLAAPSKLELFATQPVAFHLVKCSKPPKNFSALTPFTRLSVLDVSHSKATDFAALSTLGSLRELDCWATGIADLSPVAPLARLRVLQLYGTPVSDLRPLAGLHALQQLSLCRAKRVDTIEALAGLTNLEQLNLSRTRVSDLRPLAGLSRPESLWAWDLEVRSLEPLHGCRSLKLVELLGTKVPTSEVTALQRALPQARVVITR